MHRIDLDNPNAPKKMTIGVQISTENTVELNVKVPGMTKWKEQTWSAASE
jgi:hypothetical protein